jgi:hypothetical protein
MTAQRGYRCCCLVPVRDRRYGFSMRKFIVDTGTALVFFTFGPGLMEWLIVGLTVHQVMLTRGLMIPVIVVTGRPYGIWRDWLLTRLRPRGAVAITVVDTAAFISFQVPVYAATLAVAGATVHEIMLAVGTALAFMVLLSRPYGLLLDFVRRRAGSRKSSATADAARRRRI